MAPKRELRGKHSEITSSVSSFFSAVSRLVTFGFTAATSTTGNLATGAASTASQYTIEPLNAVVKKATQKYFAPSIVYPDYGLNWSTAGRKRAATATGDVTVVRRGSIASTSAGPAPGSVNIARRDSLARAARWDNDLLNGGVVRSNSFPVLTALDIPEQGRKRKPSLRPINTNIPYSGSSTRTSLTPDSRIAALPLRKDRTASIDQLSPPLLTGASGGSSRHNNSPITPVSPLSWGKTPEAIRDDNASAHPALGKSLAIARVSFWNLVKLGETPSEGYKQGDSVSIIGGKEDICKAMGIEEDLLAITYEQEEEDNDGIDGDGESYKKLCYV